MTTKELREAIVAAGGEVPTEGTGANDAVVKADLEAALAELQTDDDTPDEDGFVEVKPGIRTRTN